MKYSFELPYSIDDCNDCPCAFPDEEDDDKCYCGLNDLSYERNTSMTADGTTCPLNREDV